MDNGGRGQEAEQEGEDEDGQTGAEEDDEDAATDEEEGILIHSEAEGERRGRTTERATRLPFCEGWQANPLAIATACAKNGKNRRCS